MFRRGCLPLLVIGLLLLVFVGAGRSAAYRAGWSQGYYAAQQADGEGGAAVPPYAPYGPGGWHHEGGFGFGRGFLCLGLLLPLAFLFLFFGMIGRFVFGHRHRHGHKHFAGWQGHWGHHGSGKHKWQWPDDGDEPLDDTIRKA
jgi:hypothetical protein